MVSIANDDATPQIPPIATPYNTRNSKKTVSEDLRHQLFDQHCHPGGQAAAADRHEDPIQMRVLLQQLHRQRALPGDHRRVIERRHEGHALLMGQLDCLRFGLVEIGAVQQHFAAEAAHRIHLDVRGGHRHHDQRFDPQPFTGEGDALRVVAGRSRHDAARLLLFVQPGDHRIGPAQLEAVHRLAIFALHQNGVAETRRDFAHGLQRGDLRHLVNRRAQYRSQIFRAAGGAG